MTIGKRLTFAVLTGRHRAGRAGRRGAADLVAPRGARVSRLAARGKEILRNDAINFMKVADGHYGYVLRPGFERAATVINAQGFVQRDSVAVARRPGSLRVIAMGESTTQGHGLILIDAAAAFAHLDRAALQWDFAHMHPEGYELLAEVIYEGLLQSGAVSGEHSPRLDVLRRKYALTSAPRPS